jgi:hypothetical protein
LTLFIFVRADVLSRSLSAQNKKEKRADGVVVYSGLILLAGWLIVVATTRDLIIDNQTEKKKKTDWNICNKSSTYTTTNSENTKKTK